MKRTEIERLLPGVFRRTVRPGNPLFALLEVMESMHEPSDTALRRLDATLDPRRTADAFVPYLARWLDLARIFDQFPAGGLSPSVPPISTGLGRLRELVAMASRLAQWRGTAKGLRLFLETATGAKGFHIDEEVRLPEGQPRPFHLRILAPAESAPHRALIDRIINLEKPAYVTYDLDFSPAEHA